MSQTQKKPAYVVHVSKYGTYHPDPKADVAWTINDTRGYLDGGPSCDECGSCECERVLTEHGETVAECSISEDYECIGIAFAFCCLDGGEALCEECAEKAGVKIVSCDC